MGKILLWVRSILSMVEGCGKNNIMNENNIENDIQK